MNIKYNYCDRDELQRYRTAVEALLAGESDPERFMALRLQQGIYGQRQPERFMVRIRLPGGVITAPQLTTIATLVEHYSEDECASVTTRQDIQIHNLKLADTPQILDQLAQQGLTSREACGNTLRNVTTCPLAGLCPHEHTNVLPLAQQITHHFLRHPLTQHLPRKFKIALSGCERDCAQGMIHDIALIATKKAQRFGFQLLAAGGLGHRPMPAAPLETRLNSGELLASIEALITLHNRASNRQQRARARMKFLREKLGHETFVQRYQQERQRCREAHRGTPSIELKWRSANPAPNGFSATLSSTYPQHQPGYHLLPIALPNGEITTQQLRRLATLMDESGLSEARTNQEQNLLLPHLPQHQLHAITTQLQQAGLGQPQEQQVACPGTATCRLGITASRRMATHLKGRAPKLRLRISGCHNACAQHQLADIGLHGEGRRLHGHLIPHYRLHLGGSAEQLAIDGPAIPVQRTVAAVELIQQLYTADAFKDERFQHWAHRKGAIFFNQQLATLSAVGADETIALAREIGESEAFKVVPLGGGECAGAAQEYIAARFSEALHEQRYRDAFLSQQAYTEALSCAAAQTRLITEALLFISGLKPAQRNTENYAQLHQAFRHDPKIATTLEQLTTTWQQQMQTPDDSLLHAYCQQLDRWISNAAQHCQEIDKQLELSASLSANPTLENERQNVVIATIDLTTFDCPLHYIKARQALKQYQEGDQVELLLADDEAADMVTSSLINSGHKLLERTAENKKVRALIRKQG